MECWAEDYCKQHNTEYCNEYCIGYNQLKFLYRVSNIPKKYQKVHNLQLTEVDSDKQSFLESFRDNIVENVEKGKGLILLSPVRGNGKTTWACIMLNAYIKAVALDNDMSVRVKFISVPELMQSLKDDFNREEKEMEKFKKHIKQADLVVWDDIGAENPSNWAKEVLYNYINYRISNNLSQIYTSNKSKEDLERVLGERIFSRMLGQCQGLILKGDDHRRGGR